MAARSILSAGLLVTILLSPLWAGGETLLERNWGKSFESEKQLQIENPEAAQTAETPTGMDGVAAKTVMDKYRSSFQATKSGQRGGSAGEGGWREPMSMGVIGGTSGSEK